MNIWKTHEKLKFFIKYKKAAIYILDGIVALLMLT